MSVCIHEIQISVTFFNAEFTAIITIPRHKCLAKIMDDKSDYVNYNNYQMYVWIHSRLRLCPLIKVCHFLGYAGVL